MPARRIPSRQLWALAAIAILGTHAAHPTIAAADGEQWVRFHQGGPAGTADRAAALVVHASGEITLAGTSCYDVLVVRLDREGRVLWSYTERTEFYYFSHRVHAVPDSEGVFVTFVINDPYTEVEGRLLRLDRHGNRISSQWEYPVHDAISDDASGLIIGGTTFTGDLLGAAYVTRLDRKGGRIWFDRIGEDPYIWWGEVIRLAADGRGHVFSTSEVNGPSGFEHLISKHTLDGEHRWDTAVFPESTTVRVSALTAGASDGTLAAAGTFRADEWVARYDESGQLLWSDMWTASPHPPASPYPVVLASSASSVTYVATAAGTAGATDIRLAAYEPSGAPAWQLTYDSAPGALDIPAAIAVAPDGAIHVLGASGSRVSLLKADADGSLAWATVADPADASCNTLAVDDAGRTIVAGAVAGDRNLDFLVLEFDAAGASHEIARIDGAAMAASAAQGVAVHVGPAGEVTSAIETIYPCIHRFELVGHDAAGGVTWTRSIDGLGYGTRIAFADVDGAALAAVKRGAAVEVRRYASTGDLDWIRSFASAPGGYLDGFAVSGAGEVLLANSAYDSSLVCVVAPNGDERWRRTLTGYHTRNPTWGPDGRTYVRSYNGLTIHAFEPAGEIAWSRTIDIGAPLEVADMAAAAGGILYVTGATNREGRWDWATLGLGPGGDIDWISYEPGTAGTGSQPTCAEVLAGGDVAVTGSIRNGLLAVRYGDGGAAAWRTWSSIGGFVRDLAGDRSSNLLLLIQNGPAIRTIKISTQGDVVWDRRFAGSIPWPYEQKIAAGADLSVAVTGDAAGDSAFTLKYTDQVPVEIATLRASRIGEDVELRWEVGADFDGAGWLVSCSPDRDGAYRQLTPDWLPSTARSFVHRMAPREEAYYVLDVLHPDGGVTRHGPVVAAPTASAPPAFWARSPSPNPASTEVTWQFGLPAATPVRLVVHDLTGRAVAQLVASTLPAGVHAVHWDGRLAGGKMLPRGVYAYRLVAQGAMRSGKLVWIP